MRVLTPAAALLVLAAASAGLAQTPPGPQPAAPLIAPPQGSPQPAAPQIAPLPGQASEPAAPVPPPTTLLPPAAAASSEPAASGEAPVLAPPPKRPRRMAAILQALDKSTAESLRFLAPVGQPIRYKDLVFVVHVCEDTAPDLGQRGAAAHLEIQSQPRPIPGRVAPPTRQLFRGWMFANAPGLHPFEHPVYDAWLIGCRGVAQPGPEEAPKPAPPAPKPAAPPPAVAPAPQAPAAPPPR